MDAAKGLDSVSSADEWKWETTRNTLSVLIGTAASGTPSGEAVDPEELIIGGTYDGTLLWKRNEQFYIDTDAKLCGLCGIVTYPRQFIRHADLRAFQRLWRQGFIYSADRSVTPWAPDLIDVLAGAIRRCLRCSGRLVPVHDHPLRDGGGRAGSRIGRARGMVAA